MFQKFAPQETTSVQEKKSYTRSRNVVKRLQNEGSNSKRNPPVMAFKGKISTKRFWRTSAYHKFKKPEAERNFPRWKLA